MGIVSGYPKLIDVELEADAAGSRSITETWETLIDNASADSVWTITTALGLPGVNTTWSYGNDFDAGVYARKYRTRRVNQSEGNNLYHTIIEYRTESAEREDEQQTDDPVDLPEVISGSGIRYSRLLEKDRNDVPVTNAANDPFPDLEIDDVRPTLIIEKNFATIDLAQFVDFTNSVNQAPFWGLQPYQWKLSFPRWRQLYRGSRRYYNVRFEFEGQVGDPFPDWRLRPLEKGHWYYPDPFDQTRKERVVDSNGNHTGIAMALDASGEQRDFDADPPYVAVTDPIEGYKLRDFGQLGISTSGP